MTKSITVYAPATIANLGVGFDLLGAALAPVNGGFFGDRVTVEKVADGIALNCSGPWQHKLPADRHDNIVVQCAEYFLQQLAPEHKCGLLLHLEKNLPVGSGLGSSASSVVAAIFALNELLARPFDQKALLQLMGEFEGRVSGSIHYDNVVPSFMGGMQLLLQSGEKFCAPVPFFTNWFWVVAYPGTSLSTAKMRALLPAQYDRADLLKYGRYLSGFIHAAHTGDQRLAIDMLHDVVAEPYRSPHIPGYNEARQAMTSLGMLASGISGSGPTIFSVADDLEKANQAAQWLQNHYVTDAGGFAQVCRIDSAGVRQVLTVKEEI